MKRIRQILSCPEWWLVIIPLIAYRQIAFFQNTMQWDMTDQLFVWHRFISECFHQHILPLWCPYSRLGYPIYADPQSGVFYPATWFFTYFFDYSLYTNNLEYISHVIGAAFGMRFLLRSVGVGRYTACLFGLVYALSGPFVSNATHTIFIFSLCWLPFILGSYIRLLRTAQYRYALLMAIFLFLQISGGYTGLSIILFYVLLFTFLYYLIFIFPSEREKLRAFVINHLLLIVFTGLLCAGFLYAVLQGLPFMDRQNGVSREMAACNAFTPHSFLTFLYPGIADNDHILFGTDITMRNIYVGILTLLLVLVSFFRPSRFKIFVVAGTVFFLLAALGTGSPVRGWLYSYIPLMNMFRMASIFRFFVCMGLIILAAFAFESIFEEDNEKSFKTLKTIVSISGFLLLLSLIAIIVTGQHSLHRPHASSLMLFTEYLKHTNIRSVIFLYGMIHIAILAAAFFILKYLRSNHSLQKYLFAGLIILDMCMAVQGNVFSTIANKRSVYEIQSHIDKLPKGFPIVSNVPLGSCNEWNDSSLAPPIWHNAGFFKKQISYEGFNGYNLSLYDQLSSRKDFYQILSGRNFISTGPDSAVISIIKFNPDQIAFKVNSKSNVNVKIGQFDLPGWKLSIDGGKQTAVSTEDSTGLMMCAIPHGDHLVELIFEPAGIRSFFIYTLSIFIISLIGAVILFRRPVIL